MRQLLFILFLFSTMAFAFGQEINILSTDLILLKDNSRLYGKIINADNKTFTISIGGEPVLINKKIVKNIFYEGYEIYTGDVDENKGQDTLVVSRGTLFELVPIKQLEKLGWYNISYGNINFPGNSSDGGVGLENVTGFQFNQFTGLGVGVGFQRLDYRRGRIIPAYIQYRGYVSKRKVSPYYSLDIGFSFAAPERDPNFTSTKPGTYFYPSIGYKVGSNSAAFMIDIGFRFANLTYFNELELFSSEEKNFYNVTVLRLGIML